MHANAGFMPNGVPCDSTSRKKEGRAHGSIPSVKCQMTISSSTINWHPLKKGFGNDSSQAQHKGQHELCPLTKVPPKNYT